MAIKSEKTPGQDLISDVSIKYIREDFAGMEDSSLRISDSAMSVRFWSGVPEYSMSWKQDPVAATVWLR